MVVKIKQCFSFKAHYFMQTEIKKNGATISNLIHSGAGPK